MTAAVNDNVKIMTNPEPALVKSDSGFSEKSAHIIASSNAEDDEDDYEDDEDEVDQAVVKRQEISLERAKLIFDKRLASANDYDQDLSDEDLDSHRGDVNANGIACKTFHLNPSIFSHFITTFFTFYRRCTPTRGASPPGSKKLLIQKEFNGFIRGRFQPQPT